MVQCAAYRYRATIRRPPAWLWWWWCWLGCVLWLWGGPSRVNAGGSAEPCTGLEAIDLSNGTVITGDGAIEHEGIRYGPSQYFHDESGVRRGCVCRVRQCIYVCCTTAIDQCLVSELQVNISDPTGAGPHQMEDLMADDRYYLLYSLPPCHGGTVLSISGNEFLLHSGGQLAYGTSLFGYHHFCLLAPDENGQVDAGFCELIDINEAHRWYSVGILVSIPFLLVTFIVYALLPEMQNVPGKSLMCYVAALTTTYILLALMRWGVYDLLSATCYTTGYIVYFTLLAGFFWLNVMSFDIYWTFGGSRGRTTERRKFLFYCLYAWGTPVLLLSLVLLFDHTELIGKDMRPQIGESRCYLKDDKLIEFLYMYLPMLILVGVNVFFFGVTAKRIYQMEQATATALSSESRRHAKYEKDRYRFSLYVRLFTIMGVTWTVEIISWLLGKPSVASSSWLVYALDVCNCLTGIAIFFLFVWKQKVKTLLLQRFTKRRATGRKGHQAYATSTISTTQSTEAKHDPNTTITLTDMTHAN
uniref:Putative g-protein coupled receptor mth2 n=1 Tax=Anopheles darlingi TaxID=43151 RepID=A0A2M4CFX2_ANODA